MKKMVNGLISLAGYQQNIIIVYLETVVRMGIPILVLPVMVLMAMDLVVIIQDPEMLLQQYLASG